MNKNSLSAFLLFTLLNFACQTSPKNKISDLAKDLSPAKSELLQARWKLQFSIPNIVNMSPEIREFNKYGEFLIYKDEIGEFSFFGYYRLQNDTIWENSALNSSNTYSIVKKLDHDSLVLETYAMGRDLRTGSYGIMRFGEFHYSNYNNYFDWEVRRARQSENTTPSVYNTEVKEPVATSNRQYGFVLVVTVPESSHSFSSTTEIIASTICELDGDINEDEKYMFRDKASSYMRQFIASDRREAGTHVFIRDTYGAATKARDSITFNREIQFNYTPTR